jgi:hypothetical protein
VDMDECSACRFYWDCAIPQNLIGRSGTGQNRSREAMGTA